MFRLFTSAAALAAGLGMLCANAAADEYDYGAGAVYSSSNATGGNAVLVYRRANNGALTALSPVSTGGKGTGAGLGDQGAVAMSEDGGLLAVVNAGSNDFTLFAVEGTKLTPLAKTPSGGSTPVSVALHGDLIYVLNQGSDQISGFRISRRGGVTPIQGSSRLLSGTGVGAAQVAISRDGRHIVVTEKATSKIDVFGLDDDGVPSATAKTIAAGGSTPFGFAFSGDHTLVVSQAKGPAPYSSVETYHLANDGTLTPVGGPVSTGENAACWIVVSPGGRFAYSADAASSFVSGFAIGAGGVLTPVKAGSVSTGAGTKPLDEAIGGEGRFFYVLDGEKNSLIAFVRGIDGSLAPFGAPLAGLPASATGLVAR